MLLTIWLVFVTLAVACTAAWLFLPTSRTSVTTFVAMVAWGLTAVESDAITVVSSGQTLTIATPAHARYLLGLLALLSALALVLYQIGVYPPTVVDEYGPESDITPNHD